MKELADSLKKISSQGTGGGIADSSYNDLLEAAAKMAEFAILHHSGEALTTALEMCKSVADYCFAVAGPE